MKFNQYVPPECVDLLEKKERANNDLLIKIGAFRENEAELKIQLLNRDRTILVLKDDIKYYKKQIKHLEEIARFFTSVEKQNKVI